MGNKQILESLRDIEVRQLDSDYRTNDSKLQVQMDDLQEQIEVKNEMGEDASAEEKQCEAIRTERNERYDEYRKERTEVWEKYNDRIERQEAMENEGGYDNAMGDRQILESTRDIEMRQLESDYRKKDSGLKNQMDDLQEQIEEKKRMGEDVTAEEQECNAINAERNGRCDIYNEERTEVQEKYNVRIGPQEAMENEGVYNNARGDRNILESLRDIEERQVDSDYRTKDSKLKNKMDDLEEQIEVKNEMGEDALAVIEQRNAIRAERNERYVEYRNEHTEVWERYNDRIERLEAMENEGGYDNAMGDRQILESTRDIEMRQIESAYRKKDSELKNKMDDLEEQIEVKNERGEGVTAERRQWRAIRDERNGRYDNYYAERTGVWERYENRIGQEEDYGYGYSV